MSSKICYKSKVELTLARWANLLVFRKQVVEATRRVILIIWLPYKPFKSSHLNIFYLLLLTVDIGSKNAEGVNSSHIGH